MAPAYKTPAKGLKLANGLRLSNSQIIGPPNTIEDAKHSSAAPIKNGMRSRIVPDDLARSGAPKNSGAVEVHPSMRTRIEQGTNIARDGATKNSGAVKVHDHMANRSTRANG
jgi:hypothetical protein